MRELRAAARVRGTLLSSVKIRQVCQDIIDIIDAGAPLVYLERSKRSKVTTELQEISPGVFEAESFVNLFMSKLLQ